MSDNPFTPEQEERIKELVRTVIREEVSVEPDGDGFGPLTERIRQEIESHRDDSLRAVQRHRLTGKAYL